MNAPCCYGNQIWFLCIQTLQNYVEHFHSCIGYCGTFKSRGVIIVQQNRADFRLHIFVVSNLAAQAPDLNLPENLSTLLSNREALNK